MTLAKKIEFDVSGLIPEAQTIAREVATYCVSISRWPFKPIWPPSTQHHFATLMAVPKPAGYPKAISVPFPAPIVYLRGESR